MPAKPGDQTEVPVFRGGGWSLRPHHKNRAGRLSPGEGAQLVRGEFGWTAVTENNWRGSWARGNEAERPAVLKA